MTFGKTIKLFLIDGEPNGRLTCELSNWTGKAYKIPRIKIKDSTDREDLKNPGVYFLFGKNEEGKDQVYVGEADIAEMEAFMENIKILVSTLGHKVLEEKREPKTSHQRKKTTFYIKAARGADASGEPSSDGFVVFKDSRATLDTVQSMTPNFKRLRDQLIENGTLKETKEYYLFTEDYVFSSPSTAAAIVMGRNANGLNEWKMKDGSTLRNFEGF